MTGIIPIAAAALDSRDPSINVAPVAHTPAASSFGSMLLDGLDAADGKINAADQLVRRLVLDDDVSIHQVTFALEQARLSVQLATQIRLRLIEGYQQLMNMQI